MRHLADLKHQDIDKILQNRYQRIMNFGVFSEEIVK
jgi:acetyl-CoA carboxylase alpha subunit